MLTVEPGPPPGRPPSPAGCILPGATRAPGAVHPGRCQVSRIVLKWFKLPALSRYDSSGIDCGLSYLYSSQDNSGILFIYQVNYVPIVNKLLVNWRKPPRNGGESHIYQVVAVWEACSGHDESAARPADDPNMLPDLRTSALGGSRAPSVLARL